jgi:hypothetical protein
MLCVNRVRHVRPTASKGRIIHLSNWAASKVDSTLIPTCAQISTSPTFMALIQVVNTAARLLFHTATVSTSCVQQPTLRHLAAKYQLCISVTIT